MSIFIFAIFVALVAAPVDGGLACCYPARMEGARYYLKEKVNRYFVADYERGYIFHTLEIGSPNFTIYDLHNETIYRIRGEECSESPINHPGLFDPCLDDSNLVQGNARLGGGDHTIDVDFYDYEVGHFSVFKAVQWSEDGCFPVTTQTKLGRYSMTTMFHHVKADITFPAIFSTLRICNVDVRGENEHGGGY